MRFAEVRWSEVITFTCFLTICVLSLILENSKFWIFVLKSKISKLWYSHFILRLPLFLFEFYFKILHSRRFQTFADLPKMVQNNVTNTLFSQYDVTFSNVLMVDLKLMQDKKLKVSRWYLPRFLRYCRNPADGQKLPPCGARVNPRPAGGGRRISSPCRTFSIVQKTAEDIDAKVSIPSPASIGRLPPKF